MSQIALSIGSVSSLASESAAVRALRIAGVIDLAAMLLAALLANHSVLLTLAFSIACVGQGATILRFGTDAASRQGDSNG
ncbi:hypothetical protein SAMN05428997_105237 [Bosea sp. CRIB-10]|uniref:hypothetical protein n=1 Tax=Bosea sp. CRIB-10 TaxID=378404 RepID=UPI0008E46EE4|nr:hypothetical protein [Bosea sp. CRIB-10]SFC29482.1 hypothetical protein SAMN05428997_105237 [Bosea sp. CRIB-10]